MLGAEWGVAVARGRDVCWENRMRDQQLEWMQGPRRWALVALQMELRYGETERARQIFERYVKCLPSGAPCGPGSQLSACCACWLRSHPCPGCRPCAVCARACRHHLTVAVLPRPPCTAAVKAWVRYAKFEMKSGGDVAAARACYERAVDELGEDANNVRHGMAWAGLAWAGWAGTAATRRSLWLLPPCGGTRAPTATPLTRPGC